MNAPATAAAQAADVDAAPPLPAGLTLTESGETVTVVHAHRDLGDVFSLGFLAAVVILFSAGIGGKLFDLYGTLGALAVTSPLWGWLAWNALRRMWNRTTIVAAPGKLSIRIGPIGSAGSRELDHAQIASVLVRQFENRSSTRGGSLKVTKSWSIWVKLRHKGDAGDADSGKMPSQEKARKRADEVCLVEVLETEAPAKWIEKKLTAALRDKKGVTP